MKMTTKIQWILGKPLAAKGLQGWLMESNLITGAAIKSLHVWPDSAAVSRCRSLGSCRASVSALISPPSLRRLHRYWRIRTNGCHVLILSLSAGDEGVPQSLPQVSCNRPRNTLRMFNAASDFISFGNVTCLIIIFKQPSRARRERGFRTRLNSAGEVNTRTVKLVNKSQLVSTLRRASSRPTCFLFLPEWSDKPAKSIFHI